MYFRTATTVAMVRLLIRMRSFTRMIEYGGALSLKAREKRRLGRSNAQIRSAVRDSEPDFQCFDSVLNVLVVGLGHVEAILGSRENGRSHRMHERAWASRGFRELRWISRLLVARLFNQSL